MGEKFDICVEAIPWQVRDARVAYSATLAGTIRMVRGCWSWQLRERKRYVAGGAAGTFNDAARACTKAALAGCYGWVEVLPGQHRRRYEGALVGMVSKGQRTGYAGVVVTERVHRIAHPHPEPGTDATLLDAQGACDTAVAVLLARAWTCVFLPNAPVANPSHYHALERCPYRNAEPVCKGRLQCLLESVQRGEARLLEEALRWPDPNAWLAASYMTAPEWLQTYVASVLLREGGEKFLAADRDAVPTWADLERANQAAHERRTKR